jgi:hypothetical protein
MNQQSSMLSKFHTVLYLTCWALKLDSGQIVPDLGNSGHGRGKTPFKVSQRDSELCKSEEKALLIDRYVET